MSADLCADLSHEVFQPFPERRALPPCLRLTFRMCSNGAATEPFRGSAGLGPARGRGGGRTVGPLRGRRARTRLVEPVTRSDGPRTSRCEPPHSWVLDWGYSDFQENSFRAVLSSRPRVRNH